MENKGEIKIIDENGNTLAQSPEKRPGVLRKSRDMLENALGAIKGRDMNQLIEEFTGEMTLVAEGLSEDQEKLRTQIDTLQRNQEKLEDSFNPRLHDLSCGIDENARRVSDLEKRFSALENAVKDKKIKKVEGWTGFVRQATWLAAIVVTGWILTTVLNLLK